MSAALVKNRIERVDKSLLRISIRPLRKNTPVMQVPGQRTETFRLVKGGVTWMQQMSGRVIDVEQDSVKTPVRRGRIKAGRRGRQFEEIRPNELAPRIRGQFRTERDQSMAMPVKHGRECLDHEEGTDTWILKSSQSSISKAEPSYHHVPGSPPEVRKGEVRQRHFRFVKQAGHEKGIAQFHFKHLLSA